MNGITKAVIFGLLVLALAAVTARSRRKSG